MLGIDLFDEIPCDVNAENISNCNKARYISDVGSKRGILKLLEIWHLTMKDCAPIVKYIGKRQVNKRERKIGTDNCTR